MSFPRNTKKGFTLLETLVAIFILTLALTGPIYIATLALRTAVASRDGISARYLAEEVIEALRNGRDSMSLRGTADWLESVTGGEDCINPSGAAPTDVCELRIDPDSGGYYTVATCPSLGNCLPLRFTPNSLVGFYGLDDNAASVSKFTREFYLQT